MGAEMDSAGDRKSTWASGRNFLRSVVLGLDHCEHLTEHGGALLQSATLAKEESHEWNEICCRYFHSAFIDDH
jgi:hypothetical protein